MADHHDWGPIKDTLLSLGQIAPAAFLGAAATLAHNSKPMGLWMAVRATVVGTITATFTGLGLVELMHWGLPVGMAVAYLLGLIAYRVTPILLKGSELVAAAASDLLIDKVRRWMPGGNGAPSQPTAGSEEPKP